MTKLRTGMSLLLLAVILAACASEKGRALREAIRGEDLEVVEALIADGADVNDLMFFEGAVTTPTQIAVQMLSLPNGEQEAITLAVFQNGGDPNLAWGDPTMYALAYVARVGSAPVVQAMVDAGADIEGQERGGWALIEAARANHVEVLRILLDARAPLDFKNTMGDTALGAAVDAGAKEAIEFLESQGAREW